MNTVAKKHTILFLTLFLVFAAGFIFGGAFVYSKKYSNSKSDAVVQMKINYGEGNEQVFPFDAISRGTSVAGYLQLAERRYKLPIEKRSMDESMFIEAFHGVHGTNTSQWMYSVDEKKWFTNPNDYILKDGDALIWKRMYKN